MRPNAALLALILACSSLTATYAHAQGSGTALAETLFREGRRLMDEKRYGEACPKLAESHRIDPATGTLLALALCHEGQGKTASAWAEYTDVAARARGEGNKEREAAARQRAAGLESKLSRLTIRVAAPVAAIQGLAVSTDGVAQPKEAWGMAVPVDPGDHVIEATAPGHKPSRLTVKIGAERDNKEASIPALEADASAPPVAAAPTNTAPRPLVTAAPEPPIPPREDSSGLRTAGWVVGGVGVIGLGLGTVFAVQAMGRNKASKDDCNGDICGPQGFSDRLDAISSGNRATIGFVAGGILAAGGLAMVLIGSGKSSGPSLQASPAVGYDSVGLVLKGGM